jgi:hypothetical protein
MRPNYQRPIDKKGLEKRDTVRITAEAASMKTTSAETAPAALRGHQGLVCS